MQTIVQEYKALMANYYTIIDIDNKINLTFRQMFQKNQP